VEEVLQEREHSFDEQEDEVNNHESPACRPKGCRRSGSRQGIPCGDSVLPAVVYIIMKAFSGSFGTVIVSSSDYSRSNPPRHTGVS
jgi:hypothetical protein